MAEDQTPAPMCCICDEPVAEPDNVIGGRFYCARHYAAVNRPNPSFWRAGVIQIVGMGLFAAIVAWLAGFLGEIDRTALVLIGLFLSNHFAACWTRVSKYMLVVAQVPYLVFNGNIHVPSSIPRWALTPGRPLIQHGRYKSESA